MSDEYVSDTLRVLTRIADALERLVEIVPRAHGATYGALIATKQDNPKDTAEIANLLAGDCLDFIHGQPIGGTADKKERGQIPKP